VIRHLLKLVWNRKRSSALLIVEIFFSFLVVLVLATTSLFFWRAYRQPLGYDWHDVWAVSIDSGSALGSGGLSGHMQTVDQLLREARTLGPVVAAASAASTPYDFGETNSDVRVAGSKQGTLTVINRVTDDFDQVLGVDVVEGRWFEPADGARSWRPVVIDRDLARSLFGDEDPIGKRLEGLGGDAGVETRVVGVVADYRDDGELSARGPYLFRRIPLDDPTKLPESWIVLRLRPGTPLGFEEELVTRLQAVAPDWSFESRPLAEARRSSLRLRSIPLVAGGLVAVFLLLMVGLGLVGVLWQNVIQRTRELGLRRATGAARRDIHRQISAELLILTTLAIAPGVVLALQLPILDLAPFLEAGTLTAALVLSAAVLYALALACALYPSWLAGRVQPAEALRWE